MALNISRTIPKEKILRTKPLQRRTLFTNSGPNRFTNFRRLNKLEQEANASPTDAVKQAALYKVMILML